MKKLTFLFVFFIAAIAGLFGQKTIQLNYAYSRFTGITAENSFTVYVEKGNDYSIVVTADEAIAEHVKVNVSNGNLSFSLESGKYKEIHTLKAHVTMPELNNVTLSGSCDLISESPFVCEKFKAILTSSSDMKISMRAETVDVSLSGSSDLNMNVEAVKMNLVATSSSDAVLTGKVMTFSASCSGSSDLKASELMVSNIIISASSSSDVVINTRGSAADISLSGSSDLVMNVEADNVKINVSSSCGAKLSGKTENLTITCTGSSSVIAPELIASNVSVNASSSSSVKIHAEKTLDVIAAGSSSVIYGGSPVVNSKLQSSATLKKK